MTEASWDFVYENQDVQFGHKTMDGSIVHIYGTVRSLNRAGGYCVVDTLSIAHNDKFGPLHVSLKVSPLILKPAVPLVIQ